MFSIRVVLTLAPSMDFEVEQLDVKMNFFYSDLEETIYIEQPDGFKVKGKECMVCKLMNNLKQVLRKWYKKFDSFIESNEYKKSVLGHCVSIKRFDGGDYIVLLLSVDDMSIIRHDGSKIDMLKENLSKSFGTKDLGLAEQILSMSIRHDLQA